VVKLSTGQDSTLENWIALSSLFFGKESKPTKFLQEKADKSEKGVKEEVIADERQLILVLMNMSKEN
jgi:hypothetical protein